MTTETLNPYKPYPVHYVVADETQVPEGDVVWTIHWDAVKAYIDHQVGQRVIMHVIYAVEFRNYGGKDFRAIRQTNGALGVSEQLIRPLLTVSHQHDADGVWNDVDDKDPSMHIGCMKAGNGFLLTDDAWRSANKAFDRKVKEVKGEGSQW